MATSPHLNQELPKPGLIGRTVRFLIGGVLLFAFVNELGQAHAVLATQPGWRLPGSWWWLVAIVFSWKIPGMLKDGFGLDWKQWPIAGSLVLAAGAIIWDRLDYGALWAWPLGLLVLLLILFVLLYAGLSYVIVGLVATPG